MYQDRVFGMAYGLGVDSTAVIVGMVRRKIRPRFILFADVGAERAATYAYLPIIQAYLKAHDFPQVQVVKRVPPLAPYKTIEENMLMNATLPGATFGKGSCTMAWKILPQDKWCRADQECKDAWARGEKVLKSIGFEHGEEYRQSKANDKAFIAEDPKFDYCYPLIEWQWTREQCVREIELEGLPVPPKSACIFCPNMKPPELDSLTPDERGRIARIEEAAKPYNRKVQGLWRTTRKKDNRPGSITAYMQREGIEFTPITVLGRLPLNPNCKKFRDGHTFDPPHVPSAEHDQHLEIAATITPEV